MGEEIKQRLKQMEKQMERRDREERRGNIIIRRVEVQGTPRETAIRLLERIGVQAKIKEIKEIRKNGKFGKETEIEVKMEDLEGKKEVMRKKGNLRGRREIIEEDLTWKQKRMQWLIKEVGEKEKKQGKRVKIGYGKLIVNEKVWYWDEERLVLRDARGKKYEETERARQSREEGTGEKTDMAIEAKN